MNKVILMGRLTRDPEVRYTTNTNALVCSYSLAVNRRFKSEGQPDADFINIVSWGKTAEFCSKYFTKGQQVGVIGRMQTRNYDDKDGNKRYTMEVVADSVQFLESKAQSQNRSQASSEPSPYDYQTTTNSVDVADDPFADFGDSVSIDDNFLD